MPLKLFVSHSSRLRDDETSDAQAQANWKLLQDTCRSFHETYQDQIDVLVDYQGLQPSDQWEQCLDDWLDACHAAVILLSKRACQSEWVKKEATILSWRAAIDADFLLFVVLLDGQRQEEIENDACFRTLRLSRFQFVRGAANAGEIVAAVRPRLDEQVARQHDASTPLAALLHSVEDTLANEIDEATLRRIWSEFLPDLPPPKQARHPSQSLARGLARDLFHDGEQALQRLAALVDKVCSGLSQEGSERMCRHLRAQWVDAGAARLLTEARSGEFLALNGRHVATVNLRLGTSCFTLDRYLERAWPGSGKLKVIPVSQSTSADEIWQQVRVDYCKETGFEPDEYTDSDLHDDDRHLVVLLPVPAAGQAPDPLLLPELAEHATRCKSLIFVLNAGHDMPPNLPARIRPLEPRLACDKEHRQMRQEITTRDVIARKFS